MIAGKPALLMDLLRRAGHGDEPALRDFQQGTRTWLAHYIRRIVKDRCDQEEVLQDVYTYIWLHAAEYRGERGTPLAWLCVLARSRAPDRVRRTRRQRAAVEFDDQVRPMAPSGPLNEPAEVWQHSLLRTGLRELPAGQRRMIDMAFFDGFSHSEIAKRTGLPLGTVKTKIRAALVRLREKMSEECGLHRAA
jgi:RNA polymerase sigma-70 factor (ECF subfamily)